MKATCPHCGTYGPLETFLTDADAKAAVLAAGQLPGDLPRLVWAYLGLWRKPGSPRVLTWERAGRIIADLAPFIADVDVQWKGQRVVPNRPEFWAQAMQQVLDRDSQGKLERPLDSHGYLRAVAYEIAEKAWHQGNVVREQSARQRPDTSNPVQRRPDPTNDDYRAVPLVEALKGWREKLGVAPRETSP